LHSPVIEVRQQAVNIVNRIRTGEWAVTVAGELSLTCFDCLLTPPTIDSSRHSF
jgi:hypothetical protein